MKNIGKAALLKMINSTVKKVRPLADRQYSHLKLLDMFMRLDGK